MPRFRLHDLKVLTFPILVIAAMELAALAIYLLGLLGWWILLAPIALALLIILIALCGVAYIAWRADANDPVSERREDIGPPR